MDTISIWHTTGLSTQAANARMAYLSNVPAALGVWVNQYADDFKLYRAYYPSETFSCESFTQDIVTEAAMDIFQMASVEPDEDAVHLARHMLGALKDQ